MADILTDEDVFGTQPKATNPFAQPISRLDSTGGETLSHEDVFGTSATTPRIPRSDASIAIGGVGAGAKAVARTVADFGDMLLSVPGMAVGTAADVASRVQSLIEGNDPRAAGRIARSVRQGVTDRFSPPILRQLTEKAISAIAPDKNDVSPTDVQRGMEMISQGLEKGGAWIEKATNGAITADTFDSLVNEGMALGGIKGATTLAKAVTPKEKAPTIVPQEETPISAAAKRDVQADINATTGVTQTREALAQVKARRAQAQAAFNQDPAYADYLRNYAEEEARLRNLERPLSAPGGQATTGPRAERTGSTDAVMEEELPPGRTAPIETGAPSPLDSALEKIRSGRAFTLTAEEKVHLRDTASQYGRPELLDEQGVPIKQKGSITPDMQKLIAGLGLATGLAAYAYGHPDSDAGLLGLGLGTIAGARSALGPLLKDSGYTLKTLDRLPANKTEFTRQQVLDQLARQDVSQAEKTLVMGVLGDKKTISSNELMGGFKEAAAALKLTPKETQDYADYGLENIHRPAPQMADMDMLNEMTPAERQKFYDSAPAARTTIYQSPMELGDSNHFDEPNYFAHARSFDEEGVRHVVEVQSDVAQHAKVLTPEARTAATEQLQKAEAKAKELQMQWNSTYPSTALRNQELSSAVTNANREVREARAALGSNVPDAVAPMLKNWPKRIIREELAQTPGQPVRFATADTVAKVEGWPKYVRFNPGVEAEVPSLRSQQVVGNIKGIDGVKRFGNYYTGRVRSVDGEHLQYELKGKNGEKFWKVESFSTHQVTEALGGKELMSPEHQSIYDRYKSEIEKFLRNDLNAKPYTDPHGHTWLEVPPRPRGPTQMFGRTDVGSLAALAAFTGGAVAMHAWQDNPSLVSDVVAGLFASAATRLRPKGIAELFRSVKTAQPLESIAVAAVEREGNMRLAGIDIANVTRKTTTLVPTEAGQTRINTALDTGVTKGLTEQERAAYDILKAEYAKLAKTGLDSGVLKSALAEYSTHIWKRADPSFIDKLFRDRGTGTSPNTPYSLARSFKTLAEGKAAGLTPVSENASFIFATYAHSLAAAVENSRLLATLKDAKTAAGELYLQKVDKAPPSYIRMASPQLRGIAVHPEIEPQMKFIFDNPSSAGIPASLEIIADVSKRSAVAMSFFHIKALTDSLIGSMPAEAKFLGGAAAGTAVGMGVSALLGDERMGRDAALAGAFGFIGARLKAYGFGTSEFLKEVGKGSASPLIVRAVKSGLTFGVEKGPLLVDDAGRRFYDAMKIIGDEADRIGSPIGIKAGKPVELYVRANHYIDSVMWGRFHPGMKLEVWSKTSNILRESSIARNARDPKVRILSETEADAIASKFANDQFGGLNWTRLAMEAKSSIGRRIAQELFSPHGRQMMRIVMFAPDWTLSTARAMLAAVDKDLVNPLKWGNVARGMFEPITRGDLARQYVARSALYYLVVGDAINYSMSGHHLWENPDKIGWSYIDWGDGRKMQFSKHIMETVHWFDSPVKQGVGKLGYVPKEIANQALGTEYLAPRSDRRGDVTAGPRMRDPSLTGRAKHAAKGFVPIPLQGDASDAAVWNFLGMPLYGKTPEQKAEMRRKLDEARRRAGK